MFEAERAKFCPSCTSAEPRVAKRPFQTTTRLNQVPGNWSDLCARKTVAPQNIPAMLLQSAGQTEQQASSWRHPLSDGSISRSADLPVSSPLFRQFLPTEVGRDGENRQFHYLLRRFLCPVYTQSKNGRQISLQGSGQCENSVTFRLFSHCEPSFTVHQLKLRGATTIFSRESRRKQGHDFCRLQKIPGCRSIVLAAQLRFLFNGNSEVSVNARRLRLVLNDLVGGP